MGLVKRAFGAVFFARVNMVMPKHHTKVTWLTWRIIRHTAGIGAGCVVCLAGSYVASTSHGVLVLDTVGYMIHGVGLMPICSHLEPFIKWAWVIEEAA